MSTSRRNWTPLTPRPVDRPAPTGHEAAAEPVPPHDADALLEVDHVTLRFGGVVALNDVSFSLRKGEIFGLIGPNGAGKTTCFNAMTGVYRPTSGAIRFNGESIVGKKKHEITRLGIARTFQNIRLFPEMTALENVMVGRGRAPQDQRARRAVPDAAALARGAHRAGTVDGAAAVRRHRPARRRGVPQPGVRRSSAAWRSPGRWPPTPRCCAWTSRRPASPRRRRRICSS